MARSCSLFLSGFCVVVEVEGSLVVDDEEELLVLDWLVVVVRDGVVFRGLLDVLVVAGGVAGAAGQYGKLLTDFPNSPLRLQAAYLQAFNHFQTRDFAR